MTHQFSPLDAALPRWETCRVAAPGQTLEALVKDELRGPVAELVRRLVPELVAEELNGYGPEATNGSDPSPSPSERRCSHCRELKPLTAFSPSHWVCKECRRREWRERRHRDADEEAPRPA
jgi:hypothetical protein